MSGGVRKRRAINSIRVRRFSCRSPASGGNAQPAGVSRRGLIARSAGGRRGIGGPNSERPAMQRTAPASYDDDFALWAEEQAAALREGRFTELDLPRLLEEIDDLSGSIRREIRSRQSRSRHTF